MISLTKIKLGLLYGGKSAEHQVSLQTALAAIKALNQDKFEIHPIYITEQGQWVRGERIEGEVTDVEALKMSGAENAISPLSLSTEIIPSAASEENAIDVIFPLLHGPNGEDGTVQGLLELMNIPYVGNGVLASSAGMIGSGTVGTGCILELGTEEWLQDGDVVELSITGLGTLRNTIKKEKEAGDGHVLSSHGRTTS